ncbi:MAG: cellulase family glycosylhydrolase [Bacteroidales bacterium]|nr:cellulase family glycosylhydrolase [Bacteroidales bacterium]
MKRAALTLLFFGIFVITVQGQFISLEGRRFKDGNGYNFFPMVCNYCADIIHISSGSDTLYHVSPTGSYGFRWGYDYNSFDSCFYPGIRNDFTEIRNMGFNAIRLMGPVPEKDTLQEYGFNIISNYWPNPAGANQIKKFLTAPFSADPDMAFYLKMLNDIVAIADSCGLKVILVPSRGMLARSDNAATDVAAYLACFATYFAGNTTVMAYDLYNEPTWVDVWKNHPEVDHNKYQVCQYVAQWYDSINANDTNHLVTIGLGTFNYHDVIEWDPGIMKVDFISEHIYPSFSSNENFSLSSAINRFRDELIWTGRNIPIPWIVGEFGFAGTDNAFPPFNVSPYTDSLYSHRPYIWGTTAEQYAFVDTALKLFRNCGASGISWWQYQDLYHNQNPATMALGDYKEAFFGLLNPGRWNPATGFSAFRKPVADLFLAYDPEEPPGSFPQQSSLYYNPYNFDSTDVNTRSGTVYNSDYNIPIIDAVALIWSKVYLHQYYDSAKYIQSVSHYTFTDTLGHFNAYPCPDNQRPTTIDDIKVSSPGCQRVERGWYSAFNPDTLPITPNGSYIIGCAGLAYENAVSDTLIPSGTNAEFHGWNSVTFTDAVVASGGHCEAVARQEIVIQAEFDAATGSEVYLHLDEVFPECTVFSGYLKPFSITASSGLNAKTEIELLFHPETSPFDFELFPNPSGGKVTCRITGADQESFTLSIVDLFGRIHVETETNKPENALDLSMLDKGVYLARLFNNHIQFVRKLIIQ